MEIVYRFGIESDKNFIYATWLRGLYYGNPFYGSIQKSAFFENYGTVLNHILTKPGAWVSVACLADDEAIILGYAVHEPGILHWVSVKEAWRLQGIGRKLMGAGIETVTHITKVGDLIRKKRNWVHNPFKI